MRILILAGVAVAALMSAHPARAATHYSWCAWYDWTTSNCGFTSYKQCLATISGVGGECRPNTNVTQGRPGRRTQAPAAPGPSAYGAVPHPGEPARMIQLPNGRWVSSFGCYMDEGNGRYRECNTPDNF